MTTTFIIGTLIIAAIAALEYRSGTIVDLSTLAFFTLKREDDPQKFRRFVLYKAIAYQTVFIVIILIIYGHMPFWIVRAVANNTRELAILFSILFSIVFVGVLFWIVLKPTEKQGKDDDNHSKPA
jgi:hypothetical protein